MNFSIVAIFLVMYLKLCVSRCVFDDTEREDSAMDIITRANEEASEFFEEGDIPAMQDGSMDKGKYKSAMWPNGVIAFTLSKEYTTTQKEKIRTAIALINAAAPCITFDEFISSPPPKSHIAVIKGNGCWSIIGRTGSRQQLSLSTGCLGSGVIIHEFLHALGFYHEQSRPDRDQFVRINYENVKMGRERNFHKSRFVNSMDVPYDGLSVMHYGKYTFSKNGKPTIEWKSDSYQKLGGNVLTEKDKMQLNLLYCGSAKSPKPKTQKISATKTSSKSSALTKGAPDRCVNLGDTYGTCNMLVSRGYCHADNSYVRRNVIAQCAKSCCMATVASIDDLMYREAFHDESRIA